MRNRIVLTSFLLFTAVSCSKSSKTSENPASNPATNPTSTAATPVSNPVAAPSAPYTGKPSEFVQNVTASKPIAYFRLESTSGTSEVGGAAYSSTPSVTSSPGAPINIPNNQCVVLNGKDGAITTTQKGGVATGGSMMAWVMLNSLPSKNDHILYVAGISQGGNDFDLQFEQDDEIKFFTSGGGAVEYKPDAGTLAGTWHMIVATMDTEAKTRALYWDGKLAKVDEVGGFAQQDRTVCRRGEPGVQGTVLQREYRRGRAVGSGADGGGGRQAVWLCYVESVGKRSQLGKNSEAGSQKSEVRVKVRVSRV